MFKLLINDAWGTQKIVEISASGDVSTDSTVLWDERIDGDLPDIELGGLVRNGNALEFSQAEADRLAGIRASIAAATAAASSTAGKANAKQSFDADPLERAFAELVKDEFNALRDWLTSFKAAVAGAGTLAALKTSVAALPNTPARTTAQLKTALVNAVDELED